MYIYITCEGTMGNTRFDIAKKDIVAYFSSNSSKIYTFNEISQILREKRAFWRLSSLGVHEFIRLLTEKTLLKEIIFEFSTTAIARYVWNRKVSILPAVLSLKPESYFTHYTAMYIHDLTEQMPTAIYLNLEQSKKINQAGGLQQENIDKAFSHPPRISQNVSYYEDYSIYMLNGKHTGRLGVVEYYDAENEKLYVTDIERTLIDAAVRPNYSGGISEVLKAYGRAAQKVSVNKLSAFLGKIDYIYPYHQVIGFYLEKSGRYKESQIKLLEKFEIKHAFYLTHQMKETEYSKRWRLYYPKNF